jgi:hypothetical protein
MKERIRQAPDKSMPQVESREVEQDTQPGQEESQEKKHVKAPPEEKGQLSHDIQRRIGLQLRAMYADVVNEGVPDRFAELIRQLDKQDKPGKP